MKNRILTTLLLAASFGTLAADLPTLVNTPLNKCSMDYILGYNYMPAVKNAAAIASNQIPVLDKYKAVAEEAKDPNKPVGEQFNKEQLVRFSELRQRLISLGMAGMVESGRERDIDVLNKMLEISKKEYETGKTPADKSDDGTIYAAMTILIVQKYDIPFTKPEGPGCSYGYAIYQMQQPLFKKMNDLDASLQSMGDFMQAMVKKYNTQKVEPSKLNSAEKARYEADIKNVLGPYNRALTYAQELEIIKLMANTSDLIYAAQKNDIATGSEDLRKTINENDKAGKYDKLTKQSILIWDFIGDKLPSQAIKNAKESIKIIDSYQKKSK